MIVGQEPDNSTELHAAEHQRQEQLQAAQRERQTALKIAAEDAAAFRNQLVADGVPEDEAIRLTEGMMSWYWEQEAPWAS